MFGLYEDFKIEFKAVFGKVNKKRVVEKQLVKFKQIESASYYTA